MIGRDRLAESGHPGNVSPISSASSRENESLGQATRCVRKFAPNGQKQMRRTDNGHITACKISDACPNEMIVSWSRDHIYSFDLIRSPGVNENEARNTRSRLKDGGKDKARESKDRKRKRKNQNSSASIDEEEPNIKSRQTSSSREGPDLSLRVRYENGQSEDIPIGEHVGSIHRPITDETIELAADDSPNNSLRIAHSVAKIQALMFSFDAHSRELSETGRSDYRAYTNTLTSVLGIAATYITEMDTVIRSWGYAMYPCREEVIFQQALRRTRNSSRHFVQAAGTLAKVLGGKLQTVGRGPSPVMPIFEQVVPAPEADEHTSQTQIFSLEFLRAIALWLQGGTTALSQGFKRPGNGRLGNPRFPVPDESDSDGIDDHIIPYLLQLAQDHPVVNVDASRFEVNENRQIFEKETAAVVAFSHAIRIPLEDPREAIIPVSSGNGEGRLPTIHKQQALNFWGFKIGRSLLMKAGEGITFQVVDEAFGGPGRARFDESRLQDDIDPDEMEDVVGSDDFSSSSTTENQGMTTSVSHNIGEHEIPGSGNTSRESTAEVDRPSLETDGEVESVEDLHDEFADHMSEEYDEDEDEDEGEDEYDSGEGDDEEGDIIERHRRFLYRSVSDRGKFRESVEKDVPCSSHHRQYRGHCNVKTVKDANYFGLQDEYVVSGSDSGHVFIWDKKTTELVNILEGDEEVVNVIQGLPLIPG